MKNIKIKSFLNSFLSFGVVLLLATTWFGAKEARMKGVIQKVIIQITVLENNTEMINSHDIKSILKKGLNKKITGSALESLNLTKIEQLLEKNNYVKDAQVFVDAQLVMHIRIDQKNPILRVIEPSGIGYFIDEDGFKLATNSNVALRLPVATGNISNFSQKAIKSKGNIFHEIFQLTLFMQENSFAESLIEQIYVNEQNELCFIPKIGNQLIILGDATDLEKKMSRLQKFYSKAMPKDGWAKYKQINLKFKDQVVAIKAKTLDVIQ